MNRYEKYKDSDIAWIGEIPEHWEASPLKHICINDRYAVKTGPFGTQLKGDDLLEEGDVRVYNQKNVIYNFFDSVKYYVTKAKADTLKSFYTRPCDFLITSRGTIGRSAILPDNAEMGLLHPCLIALRIDKRQANTSFLQYYINDTDCFKTDIQLKSNATTIEVIYTEPLKGVVLPLPTLDEQTKIAEYLDWKCGEVDKIVAVREEQIKLLGELRTSVISRAVTKGLNPDAPLKDSGIPWIGSIPAHWDVRKIKQTVSGKSNFIDGDWIESQDISTIGIRYITTGNIGAGYYKEQGNGYISEATFKKLNCTEVYEGDLLISRLNEPIGRACIIPNLNNRIVTAVDNVIYRPNENEYSKLFLMYYMNSNAYSKYASLISRGATMQRISRGMLGNLNLIIPPLIEQQAIADYLDKKTAEIDSAVAKYKEQIAKLKEYRQALITEVVTGKIDVRDVVIPKKS